MRLSDLLHSRYWDIILIVGCVIVATVLLFQEILWQSNLVALGEPEIDLPAQLWVLWWHNHPMREQLVNVPFGNVDFYVLTPVHSWMASWLYPHVVLAHNLTTWLGMVLAIVGGALLGRRFSEHWLGIIWGMLAVLGSAPLIAAFRDGTGEFIWVGLLAMDIWWADRLREAGRRFDMVGLMLTLMLTIYCSWYYGAAALLMTAIVMLYAGPHWWRLLSAMLGGVVASGWWIRQFTTSDFEVRPVRESLLQQLQYGGSGPIADAGTQGIGWVARTQTSLMNDWWLDLWLWAVIPMVWSGVARTRHATMWVWVCLSSFLIGLGSIAPDGWSLPMLYGNRLLEWCGVGMHLPFHISTIGVLALILLGCQAERRMRIVGVAIMTVHTVWSLQDTVRWRIDLPSSLQGIQGPVLHVGELSDPSHRTLNTVMMLQIAHQQPIVSFPVFPTNLQRQEGIEQVRASLDSGWTLSAFQQSGVRTVLSSSNQSIPALADCCLRQTTTDWYVYEIPVSSNDSEGGE